MPVVRGFDALQDLGGGFKGLKTTDNSASKANIDGDDLAVDMDVKVWNTNSGANSEPNWSGKLKLASGQFFANLKCTNSTLRKDKEPYETEHVSVTVGTSPTYDKPNPVNQGP